MKAKIWSDGKKEFVELEITDEQQQAAAQFVAEYKDGEMFCSEMWHSLFTEEQNEALDTGTAAFVAAFLPAGLGCCQHGSDDFAIEPTN